MPLRLRIPEVLQEHGLTPYTLALRSGGRISMTAAHRLAAKRGRVRRFDAELLEVLMELLGVGVAELIVNEPRKTAERSMKAKGGASTKPKRATS